MDEDIWKRRLVLVATDVQVDGLEHDKEGLELLKNQEVTILPIKNAEVFNRKFNILGGLRPQPSMLLLLSPYDDNTYVEVSDARSLIAIEKASLTLRFCSLLGAKSVEVENIKIVDIEKQEELSIDAKYNEFSGSLSGKRKDIENMKNKIEVNANFSGGKPNFEKAEQLLKSSRLNTDPLMKHLFEMVRDSEAIDNNLNQIIQKISLTQSLQNTFDLVAKIKFPVGFVRGEFKTMVKEKIEIFISLIIKF